MHRIGIEIKMSQPSCHETLAALMWRILQIGDEDLANQLHNRKEKFKPYVWGFRRFDNSSRTGIFFFSSFDQEIIKAFYDGVNKAKKAAIAFFSSDCILNIIDIHVLEDVRYIGKSMKFITISPITISEWHEERRKKLNVFYRDNPALWVALVERNLKKRVKAFFDCDDDPKIEIIHVNEGIRTEYKRNRIYSCMFILKITGKEETIKTALYGGLGELTGSGFGMLNVI